jgi:protein MAK16
LVAGGTDEDDHLDDQVTKKPMESDSNLKQNAGKRSRRVMTEVKIVCNNLSIFLF